MDLTGHILYAWLGKSMSVFQFTICQLCIGEQANMRILPFHQNGKCITKHKH